MCQRVWSFPSTARLALPPEEAHAAAPMPRSSESRISIEGDRYLGNEDADLDVMNGREIMPMKKIEIWRELTSRR